MSISNLDALVQERMVGFMIAESLPLPGVNDRAHRGLLSAEVAVAFSDSVDIVAMCALLETDMESEHFGDIVFSYYSNDAAYMLHAPSVGCENFDYRLYRLGFDSVGDKDVIIVPHEAAHDGVSDKVFSNISTFIERSCLRAVLEGSKRINSTVCAFDVNKIFHDHSR